MMISALLGSLLGIAQALIEAIEQGAPETPFLRFGERVTMDAIDASGRSQFGSIEQSVLRTRDSHEPSIY